jgi:hypothetical protein
MEEELPKDSKAEADQYLNFANSETEESQCNNTTDREYASLEDEDTEHWTADEEQDSLNTLR